MVRENFETLINVAELKRMLLNAFLNVATCARNFQMSKITTCWKKSNETHPSTAGGVFYSTFVFLKSCFIVLQNVFIVLIINEFLWNEKNLWQERNNVQVNQRILFETLNHGALWQGEIKLSFNSSSINFHGKIHYIILVEVK